MSEIRRLVPSLAIPNNFRKKQWEFFAKVKWAVKGNDRYLLQTLVRFANRESSSWRSISTLAEEMGISEKTVRRAIKTLEKLEIITVMRKRKSDGKNYPNVYFLNFNCPLLHRVNVTDSGEKTIEKTNNDCSNLTKLPLSQRSNSQLSRVTVTDKYKKKKKINIQSSDNFPNVIDAAFVNTIDPKMMDFWSYIKGTVKRDFFKTLPVMPNSQDLEAMQWVINNFSVNPSSQSDCKAICQFALSEFGAEGKILNPIVKLMFSTKYDGKKIIKLLDRYKKFSTGLK